MDDLAYGIKYPAIIDFKIGKITYDPEATVEKINRQKKKYPEVEKLGFQLLGMRVITLLVNLIKQLSTSLSSNYKKGFQFRGQDFSSL